MYLFFTHPLFTTPSAHLISLGFGSIYLAPVLITRKGCKTGNRGFTSISDHPEIVTRRIIGVSVATLACCAIVFGILWRHVGGAARNLDICLEAAILRLGFKLPTFSMASVIPHFVVPLLFLGPLFASGFLACELPFMKRFSWINFFRTRMGSIHGLRNYIIAPITEEIVFRSCVIAVHHLSGTSTSCIIFLAPLTFGLAHIHHAYEVFHRYGSDAHAAAVAMISCIFQFVYTSSFGCVASYLFLRTGSVLPPITAHIFCNMMGFPDIKSEILRFPNHKKAIISVYVVGIVGFVCTAQKWTETSNNLYWPKPDDVYFRYARY